MRLNRNRQFDTLPVVGHRPATVKRPPTRGAPYRVPQAPVDAQWMASNPECFAYVGKHTKELRELFEAGPAASPGLLQGLFGPNNATWLGLADDTRGALFRLLLTKHPNEELRRKFITTEAMFLHAKHQWAEGQQKMEDTKAFLDAAWMRLPLKPRNPQRMAQGVQNLLRHDTEPVFAVLNHHLLDMDPTAKPLAAWGAYRSREQEQIVNRLAAQRKTFVRERWAARCEFIGQRALAARPREDLFEILTATYQGLSKPLSSGLVAIAVARPECIEFLSAAGAILEQRLAANVPRWYQDPSWLALADDSRLPIFRWCVGDGRDPYMRNVLLEAEGVRLWSLHKTLLQQAFTRDWLNSRFLWITWLSIHTPSSSQLTELAEEVFSGWEQESGPSQHRLWLILNNYQMDLSKAAAPKPLSDYLNNPEQRAFVSRLLVPQRARFEAARLQARHRYIGGRLLDRTMSPDPARVAALLLGRQGQ